MNKENYIKILIEKTNRWRYNLNQILENHFIVGKNNKKIYEDCTYCWANLYYN